MFNTDNLLKPDKKFGPIQILHDFQFVALNVPDDYSHVRDMNENEKLEYMTKRLETLCERGYGGVVLNVDFENYLLNDDSFILLDKVIDVAYNMGLRVWLYDEQYYPSGSAGGLVLKDHPELESQGLACVTRDVDDASAAVRIFSPHGHSELKYAFAIPVSDGVADYKNKIDISSCKDVAGGLCWDAPRGKWKVYCFFVRTLYEMTSLPCSLRASRRYPNIADKKAMERFVDITYEKYEKYLKKPLGSRIEAVFTDEPSILFYRKRPADRDPSKATVFKSISIHDKPDPDIPVYPYIPWANDIEKNFFDMYGFDLIPYLPEIFDETENTRDMRIKFYGLINKLVENAFVDTLGDYIHRQQMMFSGHYLREECFNRHPFMFGDILRHLGKMDIPGCDRLFSEPDKLRYSVACRVASSAAHIYGKKNVMIEASNMLDADQNITEDVVNAAITMMFVNGVDIITSYYGENLFNIEGMKRVADYTATLGSLCDGGKFRIDTLLYYPFEQLCAARIPDSPAFDEDTMLDTFNVEDTMVELMKNQICFDMINKEKLLDCTISGNMLVTDYGENVKNVVFPEIDFLDEDTAAFVNDMYSNGINVIFAGKKRDIEGINFVPMFTDDCKIESSDLRLDTYMPFVTCMHRSFDDYELYIVMNTDEENADTGISIPYVGKTIKIIDLKTKDVKNVDVDIKGDLAHLDIKLCALSAVAIVVE